MTTPQRHALPPRRLGDRMVAALCALVALLAAVGAITASQYGLSPASALVKMAADEPLAELARATDPGFVFVNPQEHYDGVYYYAIARDPLLLGPEHTRIDQAPYRYGHPAYGWLGGLVSLGQDRWVPEALLALSLGGIAAAGWLVSRLSVHLGRTPWGGLLIATSPGLLYATTILTTETVSAALIAGSVLCWVQGRLRTALLLLMLLCLTKEQYVMVPLGIGVWELAQARRRRAWPDRLWLRVAALAAGPTALAMWFLYVRSRLGEWPVIRQDGAFGAPGAGFLESFRIGRDLSRGSFDQSQIGAVSAPILVTVAVLVLLAVVAALRLRTVLDGILLGTAAVTACLGWLTLVYPHEFVRNPAIVVLLAMAVLLTRPGPSEQGAAVPASPVAGEPV